VNGEPVRRGRVPGQVVYTCVLTCAGGGAVNGEPVRRGRVPGQVVYTCVLTCAGGGAVNGEPVRRGRGGRVYRPGGRRPYYGDCDGSIYVGSLPRTLRVSEFKAEVQPLLLCQCTVKPLRMDILSTPYPPLNATLNSISSGLPYRLVILCKRFRFISTIFGAV